MRACRPQTSAPSVQFAEFNPVLFLQYYEVSSSWEAAGDTLLREDFESLPLILKRELKSRSYIVELYLELYLKSSQQQPGSRAGSDIMSWC